MPFSQGLFGPARTEARCLGRLVEHGTGVEAVRDLINVSPEVEGKLRRDAALIAERYPEEAERMLAIIAWRREVLTEFDRLIQKEAVAAF